MYLLLLFVPCTSSKETLVFPLEEVSLQLLFLFSIMVMVGEDEGLLLLLLLSLDLLKVRGDMIAPSSSMNMDRLLVWLITLIIYYVCDYNCDR